VTSSARPGGTRTDADAGSRADSRRNRAAVLAAASQAFARNGLSVSLGQIARLADVGAGTVYRHFPTKDDLMEAVLAQRIEELTQSAIRHRESAGEGAFFDFLTEVVVSAPQRRDLCQVFRAGDWPHAVYRAAGRRFDAVLDQLLRSARDGGLVRRDVDLATVQALVTACVAMRQAHPGQDHAMRLVLDSIRVRNDSRDEMPVGSRCSVCDRELASRPVGRPARYCSAACRQRAHRRRAAVRGRG